MSAESAEYIQGIKIKVDDYLTTIHAILFISHSFKYDEKKRTLIDTVYFCPGRRMQTSEDNSVSPNIIVTPDVVIRANKEYGVVAEVKTGLDRDQQHWERTLEQIKKYDDTLIGWKLNSEPEEININHDIIIMIPYFLKAKFKQYIEDKISNGELKTTRNFAAVSYTREDRQQQFFTLEKFLGNISDPSVDFDLSQILQMPMKRVIPNYDMSFCDYDPPTPYTMSQIWSHISTYKKLGYVEKKKNEYISFTKEQILNDLRNLNTSEWPNDDKCPQIPKMEWITSALNELTEMNFLEFNKGTKEYSIAYSKYERVKKPLDSFYKKISEQHTEIKKDNKITQMSLL